MLPLFGEKDAKGSFEELVAKSAGVAKEKVMGSELYLYNPQKGQVVGVNGEYICSPRLDDLELDLAHCRDFCKVSQ